MKFDRDNVYKECLVSAHKITDWFEQFESQIASYTAIWTMGAPPGEYSALTDLLDAYLGVKDWQVTVSANTTRGKGYVIPSEFNGSLQPSRGRGVVRLTRFDEPDRFVNIAQHGLYQVPGRLCFHKTVDYRLEPTGIQSVWEIPHAFLAQLTFSAQKALPFNHDLFVSEVPAEIMTHVATDDNDREQLRRQILTIGLESQTLINVPPSFVNIEETRRMNRSCPI